MALLASKSQYGPQSHSYGPGPHVPTPQYSKLGTLNTNAENPELLDDIRSWDERKVCDWLRSINCAGYSNLFQANNITGETLLECDQAVLKEIGITKVGDRVRIFVAVKTLRDRAFGNARKRNRDTLASLDQLMNNPSYRTANQLPSTSYKSSNGGSTPRKAEYNSSGALNSGTYRTNSPGEDYGRGYKGALASPQYGSSRVDNVTIRTKTPHGQAIGAASRHNASPSLDGIMGLGNVWQNCVKMIGADGSTKIFDVSKCTTAEQILTRALKKFGIYDDWSYYCVYTVEESTGIAVCLSDSELVRVCSDSTRLDRGRLILRRKGSPPSATEIKVAQEIARENAINLNMSNKSSKINKLIGEPTDFGSSSSSRKESTPPSSSAGRQKHPKLTAFFGQRPPSELIGANLSEYFPGHERELEQTIRRSIRMSRYQNRLSVATTRSYASSLSDAPPVPTVGEAWLSATAATPTVSRFNRPMSVRKSVLSPTAYDANDYSGLGTLEEEDTLVNGQRNADNRKSYMSFRSGHKVVVTDTEDSGGDSYFDDRSVASTPMTPMDLQGRAILDQYGDEDDDDVEDMEFMEENWNDLKWIKGQMIGAGSFGSVYLALNSMTGVLMAVKQVELAGSGAQAEARKKSMLDALEREIDLLKDLQHPNIVQYLASSKEGDHLNIFLEYVPGGSVSAMLNTYGPQAEPLVRNFVRQILTGLAYLHNKDIIHRDIKGANILVDNKGGIKISDFGISKKIDTGLLNAAHRPSLQGSVFWMAPEVVKQTSYTKKADIWSLGCLIVEMLTGTHPYPDCTQLQAIFKIGSASAAPTLPSKITPEAKQFLNQTFEQDYTKRPSAHELLQSPFLAPLVGGGNNQAD